MKFRSDTWSGVSLCHPLSRDASAAVTDLSKNYVQMRMETEKKVLDRKLAESSVRMRVEKKRKGLHRKLAEFFVQNAD